MLAAPRRPMSTPVDASSGLQLTPMPMFAAARPPMAIAGVHACGIRPEGPSRNQATYIDASPARLSRRARCSAWWRAAWIVSMTSAVAVPVGKGSSSTTISLLRSETASRIPSSPSETVQRNSSHPG